MASEVEEKRESALPRSKREASEEGSITRRERGEIAGRRPNAVRRENGSNVEAAL